MPIESEDDYRIIRLRIKPYAEISVSKSRRLDAYIPKVTIQVQMTCALKKLARHS